MIVQRKRMFAVNRWLFDLVLTTASFFIAYGIRSQMDSFVKIRSMFALNEHDLLPIRNDLWMLAIILPTWAILLPLFRVYSAPSQTVSNQIVTLSKAIGFAWLVTLAVGSFVNPDASNRF